MSQQALLAFEEFEAQRIARARQRDRNLAFHPAGMRGHHQHAVGEIDRFRDVVGHVDDGLARLAPHLGEQALHGVPGHRIERGERLVHQQHGGVVGERAGDGDTLLHAAGEMMRIGVGEFLELDEGELLARDAFALGLGDALHLQPERHVAERGAPREQLGEILEHDAAVHAAPGDRLAADPDFARGGREEAGDDVEQRRLAAAGRADDAQEFRRGEAEARGLDGVNLAARRVIDERNVADFDGKHRCSPVARSYALAVRTMPQRSTVNRSSDPNTKPFEHVADGADHRQGRQHDVGVEEFLGVEDDPAESPVGRREHLGADHRDPGPHEGLAQPGDDQRRGAGNDHLPEQRAAPRRPWPARRAATAG